MFFFVFLLQAFQRVYLVILIFGQMTITPSKAVRRNFFLLGFDFSPPLILFLLHLQWQLKNSFRPKRALFFSQFSVSVLASIAPWPVGLNTSKAWSDFLWAVQTANQKKMPQLHATILKCAKQHMQHASKQVTRQNMK